MNIELSEQEVLRRQSLNALRELGINPYPAARYEVNASAKEIAEQFESCLSGVLAEMFDPKKPFSQANDPLACTYCDYAAICGKKA